MGKNQLIVDKKGALAVETNHEHFLLTTF